ALAREAQGGRLVRALLVLALPRAQGAAAGRLPLVPQGHPAQPQVAAPMPRVRAGVRGPRLVGNRVALARAASGRDGVRGLLRVSLPRAPGRRRPGARLPAARRALGSPRAAHGSGSKRHSFPAPSPAATPRMRTPKAASAAALSSTASGAPSAATRPP